MGDNRILKSFVEKVNSADTEDEIIEIIKEIEEYLLKNPTDNNLKVLLANLYIILNAKNKVIELLENINVEKLEDNFKSAYLIMLFNIGDFETLLKVLENLEKSKWIYSKKKNLVLVKLLYILVAEEYLKLPLIEKDIKDIYETILETKFAIDKFIENFDFFLSAVVEISKLDNIEYLLYKAYLYLKAKLLLKDTYDRGLKIVKDVLSDISSRYIAYFSLSTDEKNLILFIVIDDLFFESIEEFLEFRINTEKEIKDKIKMELKDFPNFTVVFPNPTIEEIKEKEL